MKKYKYLLTILIFFAVLLITNNVNANLQHYGYMTCGGKRWNLESDCSNGTANNDVIAIDYSENGSISFSLTADAFDKDYDVDHIEKKEDNVYMTYHKRTSSKNYNYIYYDLSSLQRYYSQTKQIPEELIVFVRYANVGAYEMDSYTYYYFGVSEYDLFDKIDESRGTVNEKSFDRYYFSVNESLTKVKSCSDLVYYKQVLEEKMHKLGPESDEVHAYAANLENKCQNYLAFNDNPSNSCYAICRDLDSAIADMGIDIFNETNSCGFGEKMVAWIIRILKILRFIVPTLVIVLSTYEYINAFMAAEDDAFKKVGGRFGKRLFIMILFFVLPSLIQFILNVFNVDGFDSSNPYCIK